MNEKQNLEILFRKNIIFVDRNSKNELKKYEYLQNYEEEKFVKQNILYKEKTIEIIKKKVVYVDKLTELPIFIEDQCFDDNKKKEIEIYRKVLEQFKNLTTCNSCNESLSDRIKIPALYDCNHTVCDQCYFKNVLQCPFCGMLNVDKTLKINITLADLINNFTKLLLSQINPHKEETKSIIITEDTTTSETYSPQISKEIDLNSTENSIEEPKQKLRKSNEIKSKSINRFRSIVNTKTITLTGHTNYIWSLIKIKDNIIASGGGDDQIKIWDISTNECIKSIKNLNSLSAMIKLNENEIAIGSEDSKIKIINIYTAEITKTLQGHTESIWCLVKIDDDTISSGSEDKTIKIWNIENEKCIKTLTGHKEFVWSLLKLNKEKIVSASGDDSIRIWNINTGECIYTREGHAQSVWSLIKINENTIATGGVEDETVKIWDIITGECLKVFKGFGSTSSLIKFNDECIITGSEDSSIKIWSLENGALLKTLKGHSDAVRSLVKLNNSTLCSGSADNTIKIWKNFMND